MLNDFLLLVILSHNFFFPGVQDEMTKYEVGKSMLISIAVFIIVNIYFFLNKVLSGFRIWMLYNLNPQIRYDLFICLGYINLQWVVFNSFVSKKEREEEREAKELLLAQREEERLKLEKELGEQLEQKEKQDQISAEVTNHIGKKMYA
jgi:hypothetical protein